ncbi:MAG: Rrf2 family transcriptional regulator [Fuerstiella sp.]
MISQTAEYALRAVVFLARQNDTPVTRIRISEEAMVSPDYLTRVMQLLADNGIVTIKRGPGGGYMLAPPKERLTVLDVISSVETLPRINQCPLGISEHQSLCPLHAKLDEATALVEQAFQDTLILDLITPPDTLPRAGKTGPCSFPPEHT